MLRVGSRRLDLAVERDGLAGVEAALQIAAIEPHAFHGQITLADGHFEDGHAAGAEERGAADLGDDGGGFAGLELVERARVLAVFVAEGQVVEEIFGDEDAFFFEDFGYFGAYSANPGDWGV